MDAHARARKQARSGGELVGAAGGEADFAQQCVGFQIVQRDGGPARYRARMRRGVKLGAGPDRALGQASRVRRKCVRCGSPTPSMFSR